MSESAPTSGKSDASQAVAAADQSAHGRDAVRQEIIEALKLVYDPEIPVSIYDLGLIYDIQVDGSGDVQIKMTLTSPACPVAQDMPVMVKSRVETIAEVTEANVEIVWDPPWTAEMMSDEAKVALDMFYY